MKELRDIVSLLAQSTDGTGLLATVVEASGSTYRRPGARMLVLEDGRAAGSISGGCLEADVIERGRALGVGACATATYDTRSDSDVVWGLGLGCNGVVTVLIERVAPGSLAWLAEALARRERVVCAQIVRVDGDPLESVGARIVAHAAGDAVVHGAWDAQLLDATQHDVRAALADGISKTTQVELPTCRVTVLIESIEPPMRLVVFGAGQDAVPVVRQAALLGWDVTVVDHRPALATKARFPEAESVRCVRPERAHEVIHVDERTAVVLMTHNLVHDRELLGWIVDSPVFYVGVLGPRQRTERFVAAGLLARLHAPIGLDIGADSPEQIALAIVAEIQAVRAGHAAGFLRDRSGSIHRTALRATVGVVVLAAGGSSRLGTPKQLLEFQGRSLLRHATETAVEADCGPVVVVLGAEADALHGELDGLDVAVVENPDWRDGLGSSIRVGVEHLMSHHVDAEAVVLTLGDQPLVTPDTIRQLVERHRKTRAPIVACAYGDTLGVPALFDASLVGELAHISPGHGAKDLIASHGARVASIHVPSAVVDVDTADDYAQLLATVGGPSSQS